MRINDLARDLEVKSRAIIDALPELGIEGKKSHSSSLEPEEVEKVRAFFKGEEAVVAAPAVEAAPPAEEAAPPVPQEKPAAAAPPPPRPPEVRPMTVARPAGARVLRPPVRTAPPPAAPPPPVAAAPAPPVEVVLEPPPPPSPPPTPPPAAATLSADAAATGPAPAVPRLPGRPPLAPARYGGRPSLLSGAPPAGSVPAGTIISRPGDIPGLATQRPATQRPAASGPASRPIYQPRPGVPTRPGAPGRTTPGRGAPPSRAGAAARQGAAAPAGAPRRPMHPTRMRPGAPGAPGVLPPPGAPPPSRQRPRPQQQQQQRDKERQKGMTPIREPVVLGPREIDRAITITDGITIKDLAERLNERAKDLIAVLIRRGVLATINQPLDTALAIDIARHFGAEAKVVSFEEQETAEAVEAEEPSKLVKRPPVVTIMGHVDHGKTSLLDAIRETNVTASEFGGITQHIGAYQVQINGRGISFIDTPGHEAFTRMRARGAKVTDIVVLVVAADDGVMPQTLEAIDHARAAKVPIIVAVNKIDKPEAMPERVKKQLGDRGLMPEEWGGDTVTVEVSAKQRKNLDLLLEMILLVADLQDLKSNPERPANGTVLEAKLDRGRGPVATVLVQNGTLRVGDPFIVGPVFSKVRALIDDRGRTVEEAPPSCPVEVLGLGSVPQAGDQFQVIQDVVKAKQTALYREQRQRELQLAASSRVTLEQLHEQMKAGVVKELPIILKADVQGSAEVLADALGKIHNEKVKVKIIHTGVGAITESDVLLATASNAIIVGFNVRPERKAEELAELEKVDIRLHTIIYEVTDEVKRALTGLLEPTTREVAMGRAEVRQTFRISKVGNVAGCYVQEGRITRQCEARLVRDSVVIHTGKIGSLRRFKDDASEVKQGFECGITLDNYSDYKPGDVIEAFLTEKVQAAPIM
jgi:translation initiation factor IF-2